MADMRFLEHVDPHDIFPMVLDTLTTEYPHLGFFIEDGYVSCRASNSQKVLDVIEAFAAKHEYNSESLELIDGEMGTFNGMPYQTCKLHNECVFYIFGGKFNPEDQPYREITNRLEFRLKKVYPILNRLLNYQNGNHV